uniref:Uncharacterized protein n=1 Tax=Megaselia scalaris TaxID=36166 RepID=T1GW54_MEGSC
MSIIGTEICSPQHKSKQNHKKKLANHHIIGVLGASATNTPTSTSTPPMDVTPPKSPSFLMDTSAKNLNTYHEMMSNSSEVGKNLLETEDDETINMPIYNSHVFKNNNVDDDDDEEDDQEQEEQKKEEHMNAAIDLSAQSSTPIKDDEETKVSMEEESSTNTTT